MSKVFVPGAGPWTAALLFIGEAPGHEEEAKGTPFMGAVGQRVRGMLRAYGLDVERDVRFNNAIPYNLGTLPPSAGGLRKVVEGYWDNVADDLARCTAKVVVACGRAALLRLTGRTGIAVETGGVIAVGQRLVVPVIHPASVMRTKTGAKWALVDAAVQRAVALARGHIPWPNLDLQPRILEDPSVEVLDAVMSRASTVAVDTEFYPDTNIPFLIGLTVDGRVVYSLHALHEYVEVLARHMRRRTLRKVFHHHPADVTSLSRIGVNVAYPLGDTLLAYAMLYPDLPVGLSHVARHLLDGVENWKAKGMEMVPYNALDVATTWWCWEAMRPALVEAGMWETYERELLPVSSLAMAMEDRGLYVDKVEQHRLLAQNRLSSLRVLRSLRRRVAGVFERRTGPFREEVKRCTLQLEGSSSTVPSGECPQHPNYNGLVKPRGKAGESCRCGVIYESRATQRAEVARLRKTVQAAKLKMARYQRPFAPANAHDIRWLYYDKDALALPKQYKREGERKVLTTNADAVARLVTHAIAKKMKDVEELLYEVQEYKHLLKMRSTYLRPRVDAAGLAHPEYRAYGTGTGRMAGGSDEDLDDRRRSAYSYNVLNIPVECRSIYVPRPGKVAVVPGVRGEVEDGDDEASDEGTDD